MCKLQWFTQLNYSPVFLQFSKNSSWGLVRYRYVYFLYFGFRAMWIVTKTCQCGMPGIIPAMPGIIPGIPGIIPAIPGIIAMAFVALWQLQWHLRGTNARNPKGFCSGQIFLVGKDEKDSPKNIRWVIFLWKESSKSSTFEIWPFPISRFYAPSSKMWPRGVSHVGGSQVTTIKITPHLFGQSCGCIFQLQEMLATNWGVQDPIENNGESTGARFLPSNNIY